MSTPVVQQETVCSTATESFVPTGKSSPRNRPSGLMLTERRPEQGRVNRWELFNGHRVMIKKSSNRNPYPGFQPSCSRSDSRRWLRPGSSRISLRSEWCTKGRISLRTLHWRFPVMRIVGIESVFLSERHLRFRADVDPSLGDGVVRPTLDDDGQCG